MSLPHFKANGWQADVLTVDPTGIAAPSDDTLLKVLPPEFEPRVVQALPLSLSRIPGLGTLSTRAYGALKHGGDRLIQSKAYDLIFFSTTQFGVFSLGPYWKKKWNIPFALDLQDPWINFFYKNEEIRPPGGHLKFNLQQMLATHQARKVVPECSGLCAVSTDYIHYFERCGLLTASCQQLTLPFAYAAQDWVAAKSHSTELPWQHMNPDRTIHWVYAGRGGEDLKPCLRALFHSLTSVSGSSLAQGRQLHLWFIGTHYGLPAHQTRPIERLAADYHFPNAHEIPQRLPYLDVLHIMQQSDGLIIPGSIDSNYQPSKLLPLLAAGRPLLAFAPSISPCAKMMLKIAPDHLIDYELPLDESELTSKLERVWQEGAFQLPSISENTQTKLSSRESAFAANQLCRFFEKCLNDA